MKRSKSYIRPAIIYFFLCALFAGFLWTEHSRQSSVSFEENVRPGRDRLFVRVRMEAADSLFTSVTKGDRKTAKKHDGKFVISHPSLGDRLARTGMGDGLWNELHEVDPGLNLSKDGNKLEMSIDEDEETGEEFVWVPAGVFSLFIK